MAAAAASNKAARAASDVRLEAELRDLACTLGGSEQAQSLVTLCSGAQLAVDGITQARNMLLTHRVTVYADVDLSDAAMRVEPVPEAVLAEYDAGAAPRYVLAPDVFRPVRSARETGLPTFLERLQRSADRGLACAAMACLAAQHRLERGLPLRLLQADGAVRRVARAWLKVGEVSVPPGTMPNPLVVTGEYATLTWPAVRVDAGTGWRTYPHAWLALSLVPAPAPGDADADADAGADVDVDVCAMQFDAECRRQMSVFNDALSAARPAILETHMRQRRQLVHEVADPVTLATLARKDVQRLLARQAS